MDSLRAIADKAIREAKLKAYGFGTWSNKIEGDYGLWDEWRDLIESVVAGAIAQANKAGQEAMRERAAVAQCWYCQQGRPIDHIDLGKAFHLDSKGCPTMCTGQDIRALPVE